MYKSKYQNTEPIPTAEDKDVDEILQKVFSDSSLNNIKAPRELKDKIDYMIKCMEERNNI